MVQDSPMLAQLIDQGTEGVLQNASATGGLRGGNTQRGLADFRASAFNSVLTDQLSRLGGLAGMGQGAVGSVGAFGANSANQIGASLGNIGSSQAGRYLGQAGVNNQMINNIAGILGGLFQPKPAMGG